MKYDALNALLHAAFLQLQKILVKKKSFGFPSQTKDIFKVVWVHFFKDKVAEIGTPQREQQ